MEKKKNGQELGSAAMARMRESGKFSPRALKSESRVDLRHASAHLSEKRPGYYLIMLRHEIRHRSLRGKAALAA